MFKLIYLSTLVMSLLVIFVYTAKIPNEDEGRVIHDHVKNFINLLTFNPFIYIKIQFNIFNSLIKKLSDQDHYVDTNNDKKMEHNVDYDHDAFLGKEEAEKFKTLSPEESKERLG